MNYSTIKKAVTCSLIAALGFTGAAQAQDAKVFGGRSQYRTWSLGINGGVTLPAVITGGGTPYNAGQKNVFDYTPREYYGISLRKQFSHLFSLQANVNRGRVLATVADDQPGVLNADGTVYKSVETDIQYAASISGVFQLWTIDFLRRENAVNFYASLGYGLQAYNPKSYTETGANGTEKDVKGSYGEDGDKDYIHETYVPIGAGVKFKLSDRVALDIGHTMNYSRGKNLYGTGVPTSKTDKYSYTYAGLEFSLGSKDKPNLTWDNPVATLYDELKDPELRNEVDALKQRVSALESTVQALSTDSDGDGVADKFDKCPNTPAGTQVDGSGCPIKFPEPDTANLSTGSYSNIQFEFDSSVLKTSSYPVLDQVSSDLRASGATITLEGNASEEGTEDYNYQLGLDRANSVKNYLVNSGVAADQINVVSNGETKPVASNATEEGRQLNRNVQFKK
ncbi:hypothetical protein GCM10023231_35790 [Olivibacter ginsenosidimutans]|uniref:OmpA-like domain-containing protein n=1 Tax=Olivibacter ginsenosidimutans TaxID=1176537 RepID=A0ABP9C1J4_9SPHI